MPVIQEDLQGSNRVQLIRNPPPPGKCAICGYAGQPSDNPDQRKFIDFGLGLDYYGAVLFCETCIVDVVRPLGFVPPEEYDSVVARLQDATGIVGSLEDENATLRTAVAVLSGGTSSASVSTPNEVEKSGSSGVAKPKSNPSESPSSKGRNDVPSAASDDPIDLTAFGL